MPQTKKQEIVYTVMMVCVMVYGMVCYNIALDVGDTIISLFSDMSMEEPLHFVFCSFRQKIEENFRNKI